MAADLLADSDVFRSVIEACSDALAPHVDWRLPDVLRRIPGSASWDRVDVIQPALFSVMVGLAELWRSFGVEPTAVIGHSNGEIPAAVVSGGLSLEDGARVVSRWSRLQIPLSGRGGMMLVPRRPAEVAERLARMEPGLHLAAYNGPASTALSGRIEAIERALAVFNAEGVKARRINIDVPAHTHLMDIRDQLLPELAALRPRAAAVPFYSSLAGGLIDTRELGPEYWYRCMSEPVLFDRTVRALADADAFLELSPHPVLTVSVRQTLDEAGSDAIVVGSLRRGEPGPRRVLASLAELHVHGVPVDWSPAFSGSPRFRPGMMAENASGVQAGANE
jgi:acyl transferase domain-containing protein